MYKKSQEEWIQIIKKAYEEGPSDRAWCRNNEVPYRAFTGQKYHLNRAGKIEHLSMIGLPAFPEKQEPRWLIWQEPTNEQPVCLVLKPICSNLCMDSIAALIQFGLGLNPRSGQIFVFINRSHNQVFAFHWCGNGFCLYSRKLEFGTLRWPTQTAQQGTIHIRLADLQILRQLLPAAYTTKDPV